MNEIRVGNYVKRKKDSFNVTYTSWLERNNLLYNPIFKVIGINRDTLHLQYKDSNYSLDKNRMELIQEINEENIGEVL